MSTSKQQQVACDVVVKDIFKNYSHLKCTCSNRRKYATKVTGKYLNTYLSSHRCIDHSSSTFNSRRQYYICSNLYDIIKKKAQSKPSATPPTTSMNPRTKIPKTPKVIVEDHPPTPLTRSQRLHLRQRIPANDPKLRDIKQVNVSFADEKYVIPVTNLRLGQKKKFEEDVLESYYKIPFGKLTMRMRRQRMADIGKIILGACIDRKEFRKDYEEYMYNNQILAVELMNLMDGIKEYIQSKMKLNMNALEEEAIVPVENDNDGLINELDEKKKEHMLAISLLGITSEKGYNRMKKNLKGVARIPTFKKITENRPTVVPVEYPILKQFDCDGSSGVLEDSTKLIPIYDDIKIKVDEYNTELDVVLRATSNNEDMSTGAKIEGGYERHIELMEKKHQVMSRDLDSDVDDVIVIDSIDGAEHLRSKKQVTSLISFSSSLLNSTHSLIPIFISE